ncbi:MAG: DnaB-like helicase C-terminal domain-containing protein [Oscillospiraceae bacterium]
MIVINFSQQVDKKAIFLLLGCYCNNPKLAVDEKSATLDIDYPEMFHKLIWGTIVNISKKGTVRKITSLEIENEISQFDTALSIWKNNNGWAYVEEAIEMTKDKLENVGLYYDDVRKYSIIRNATEELKLDVSFIYDETDEEKTDKFVALTSSDVLNIITNKFLDFKNMWKNSFGDNYSFHAGDGVQERLEEHKRQDNTYGYPFQSGYLTTVFKGMRGKKFIIRSSISGGGKSRSSMSDALNIACDKLYDWSQHKWIPTGDKEPVLFISTELTKEEIQDCLLAHISGIEQDRMEEWRDIGAEEESVLKISAKLVEESMLYCEYMPDFTIDSINDTVERYVMNKGIKYCFFDYINDSPSLYSYYYEKTKSRLRTDQILFLFSNSLKLTCNKYNVYLGSATQLNDSYKDDGNKDASALKGSKAIVEKADGGILALPVTHKDLKKLEPILKADGNFGTVIPNMSYYIFKNRGGKWKSIIIWTRLNLGTMREMDCFVTDYNFELVGDIEKTLIDFQIDDVGNVGIIETDDVPIDGVDIATELSRK